jgi:predicted O-linked N-acetylglucosamine transferase (SPINDLY family)
MRTGPLRVGFVSGDLKVHPTGYFLESMLEHVDRRRIELVAYPTRRAEDELTARIKPRFAAWTCLASLSDEQAARRIRDDRIDLLVDLSGHMNWNRLPLFAWRPAPVQASWLGYFATTGLSEIDYLLADAHVVPPGEEGQYTERIWRLPDSYLCFTLPTESVAVAPLPALANGSFTFGCLNNHKKLNDGVIAAWSRILHGAPHARLLLKNHQLGEPAIARETLARFSVHGIDETRLLLEGPSSREQYFATYHRVDLALDPFPYPGGTTSVEGLWMGVPVLTRRGERFVSHLGEMVLKTVGLSDWIAADTDDYVARAVAAAADPAPLAALRAGLRARVERSPLADAPRFTAHWMAAIEQMWQTKLKEIGQ